MSRHAEWVYGWLLLLPAMALLALFTHYPAVANFWHSFRSTPKGDLPTRFVGLENYQQLVEDPIFWQALTNNLWFALGVPWVCQEIGDMDYLLGSHHAAKGGCRTL